jgi:hypothetical protein
MRLKGRHMSEEKKEEEKGAEFIVNPISDDELEDVSGGGSIADAGGCSDGSGCCDGFAPTPPA